LARAGTDGDERQSFTVRVAVTDRSHHRRLLQALTGVVAQEHQALASINEINELRAQMGHERNRSANIGAAAFRWLEERYRPLSAELREVDPSASPAELYCDLLAHKWLVSEREQRDIGHDAALAGYRAIRAAV